MIKTIKKRDGRITGFDINKISNAIFLAAKSIGGNNENTAKELSKLVLNYLENEGTKDNIIGVEHIQYVVEKILIESGHAKTAKSYILYRADRTRVREMNTKLMKIYEGLTFKDAKDNDVKRENANIDGDTAMGTMLKYGSEGAKRFYEMYIPDPKIAKAHAEGDIHIHDLDFLTLTTTCCQIDMNKLFNNGFSTGHGFLREPNDIMSYAALTCIAIQANQNDQHGGQSIPNFDYDLAKGVAKTFKKTYQQNMARALELLTDIENPTAYSKYVTSKASELSKSFAKIDFNENYKELEYQILCKEISSELSKKIQKFAYEHAMSETNRTTYQAMEALIHNLNTMHSRAGAQVPFSSINYGTDTSAEGRLIIKNVLLATEAGLGNNETPIFPIHIFKVKEGVNYNEGDPNYDLFKLACKVSSKRLFPNFSFLDAPFNLQYYKKGHPETEAAYMGCRTRVVANHYDKSREIVSGRGNLSFTSVNLPRIAIKSKGNINVFFKELDEKINLVVKQLLDRFELQAVKKIKNFPFLMGQGVWMDSEKLSSDDEVREVLKHGTLALGFIGLAETLKELIGKHHGESQEAQ